MSAKLRQNGYFTAQSSRKLVKRDVFSQLSFIFSNRGAIWDPKNQRFLRNRGLFRVKVSENGGGGVFYMENADGSH